MLLTELPICGFFIECGLRDPSRRDEPCDPQSGFHACAASGIVSLSSSTKLFAINYVDVSRWRSIICITNVAYMLENKERQNRIFCDVDHK